jgi:hypothetical protein
MGGLRASRRVVARALVAGVLAAGLAGAWVAGSAPAAPVGGHVLANEGTIISEN